MKRGFLLILGSVALAIVGVGAELGPGYPRASQVDPLQLQYLPGEGPPEDAGVRRKPYRARGGQPRSKGRPTHTLTAESPLLPDEFTGNYDGDSSAVPGEPGVDYPTYSHVPVTSFNCTGKPAGYYADPETRCQTFHVCTPGGSASNSFLCPNGTLFNPAVRTCDWWPAVDCGTSSESLRIKQGTGRFTAAPGPTGGPGSRIHPRRKEKRPPIAQIRQPSVNEVLPHRSTPSTARPLLSTERQQYQSVQYNKLPSLQPSHDTRRIQQSFVQQTPQPTRPTYVTDNQEHVRRRPSVPKPFSGSVFKQKQQARVTTPTTIQSAYYTDGEVYRTEKLTNPTTVRTTQGARKEKLTASPQALTRFDFTGETLEFPSLRTAPTTTYRPSYRPSYATKKEGRISSPSQGSTTNAPVRTAATTPYRSFHATEREERLHPVQRPTTNAPAFTETREYKTTRLVTQVPSVATYPLPTQPQTVRISALKPTRVSFLDGDENRSSSSRRPMQVSQEVPLVTKVTTPSGDHFFDLPKTNGQAFRNPTSTTTQSPVTEGVFQPIVVASPKQVNIPFGSVYAQSFAQSQAGFAFPQDTNEKYRPFTSGNAQSFTQSQVTSTDSIDSKQEYRPLVSGIAQSLSQSQAALTDSLYDKQEYRPLLTGNVQYFSPSHPTLTGLIGSKQEYTPLPSGIAQSFSQTQVTSTDSIDSKQEYRPLVSGIAQSFSQSQAVLTDSIDAKQEYRPLLSGKASSFSESQATKTDSIDSKQVYMPLLSGIAQSFASAGTFVSDEGFSQSAPVSTTTTLRPTSKPTSSRPITPILVQTTTTVRPSPTTIRVVYTPTVPQTTARPTTTTTPAPKRTTSIATTTFTPRTTTYVPRTTAYVPTTATYAPRGTTPTPISQPASPTSVRVSGTTKKLKGFYITVAPQTRLNVAQQHFQKDKAPLDNSLSNPSKAYLPHAPETPTVPTLLYQSTRPAIPDSYFRSSLPPSQTQYSSTTLDDSTFSIQSVPDSFDSSGFRLNSQAKFGYQQNYPTAYGLPQQSPVQDQNVLHPSNLNLNEEQTKNISTTTEASFVIQKSVELFAAHEVAFHPSVFSQSSYSLTSLQDGYGPKDHSPPGLRPPPLLSPSPDARGFGKWNSESDEDKVNTPIAS